MKKVMTREQIERVTKLCGPEENLGAHLAAEANRRLDERRLVSVWISGAVDAMLLLDNTAADRGIECTGFKRQRLRRGWASRTLITGSREAIERIATELDAVAAGLLCDDTDDPAATKRAARAGAEQIRKQLGGTA